MPKTRSQKEEILAKTQDRLQRAAAVVFVSISGVKVGQIETIREELFKHGLQLQIAKNNLFKIAIQEAKLDIPAELLDQPLGMIFSYEDQVVAAKTTAGFSKEIEALQIVGGLVDQKFIAPSQVSALATLPSREQLLAQLVGTLAAPMSGMVNVMAGNLRGLVQVLSQIQPAA